MLDFSHVPSNQQDRQIFYAISGSNSWQTWQKPRGAKMVSIMCVGAGGGGAPGRSGSSIENNWGGGGGASGGITKVIFPAFLVPDILYVQVGIGGRGGISTAGNGTIGTKGTDSIVSVSATTSSNSVMCIAPGGNTSALSVNGGTGAGVGGTSTTYNNTNALFIGLGVYSFESTIAGKRSSGNAIGSDASTNALSNSVLTGGAGGGSSVAYLPGSIFAASTFLLTDVLGSSQNDGISGQNGYGLLSPIFCGTGGAGGAGNSGTAGIVGGRGGNGFIGCGGGGGGGYYGGGGGIRGGNGGNGGDGIIFITSIF